MIQSIGHIALCVRNLDESVRFYTEILGGKRVFDGTENGKVNLVYVKLAENTYVELFRGEPAMETKGTGIGFMHLCLTVEDIYETEKMILRSGWPASPVRKGKYGNYQIWFKDPDENEIELMQILPDYLMGNA